MKNSKLTDKERQIVDFEYEKYRRGNICPHTTNPLQLKSLCGQCNREHKILVIAESYNIFRLTFQDLSKYKYVTRLPDDIRGEANCDLILFGRYWRAYHWDELEDRLRGYCESHNIKVSVLKEREI